MLEFFKFSDSLIRYSVSSMFSVATASLLLLSVSDGSGRGSVYAYDLPARLRATKIVAQMRLEEKFELMGGTLGTYTGNIPGIERLGIPPLGMQDGPQGFRAMENRTGPLGSTTAWPSVLSVAASWDAELVGRWGAAMGAEFRGKGANVQLGPGIGLARVPVAGRNFEYLCGEDPYLGARLVGPLVQGIQSQGVIANAKHFINNEIEEERQTVDAVVSERVQWEIYYPVFQAAVDAGVLSVMCAYNRVNSVHACENPTTLRALKETMGFQGWVMSDWMATHSTAGSLNAGLDQELPLGLHYSRAALTKSLEEGEINEAGVDEAVTRYLTALLTAGIFDDNDNSNSNNTHAISNKASDGDPGAQVSTPEHVALAREIGAQSTVLLKNKGDVLPLSTAVEGSSHLLLNARILVVGDNSTVSGTGSGYVTPAYVVTAADGVRAALTAAGRSDVEVIYNDGSDIDAAVALTETAAVILVVTAVTSGEASDRETLSLGDHQNDLVTGIARAPAVTTEQANLVVAVVAPGAVLLPWVDEVSGAVLVSWLPGQESGNALADILFGVVNPSGRLPVTFPNKDNEVGFTPEQYPGTGLPREAVYSEELLVGYRWYDAAGVQPLFPFGYGLSYTSFNYSSLEVQLDGRGNNNNIRDKTKSFIKLSLNVTNTGRTSGAEVVQLYVGYPAAAGEPPSQLRQFVKTSVLPAGTSTTVTLTLTARDLSVWRNSEEKEKRCGGGRGGKSNVSCWHVVPGAYSLRVGASSRDIRLQETIQL